jgi:hypothetical protein
MSCPVPGKAKLAGEEEEDDMVVAWCEARNERRSSHW